MTRFITLALVAFVAGCTGMQSTGGGPGQGGTVVTTPANCDALERVLAPRRAAYERMCANAKDPAMDDKCAMLDGINLAIEGCWASAGGRPTA